MCCIAPKPNGLAFAFADLVQDHRGAETLQVRQHLLSFLIEFDVAIFERMIDDLAGLVMLDADRRLGTSAIAAPLDVFQAMKISGRCSYSKQITATAAASTSPCSMQPCEKV